MPCAIASRAIGAGRLDPIRRGARRGDQGIDPAQKSSSAFRGSPPIHSNRAARPRRWACASSASWAGPGSDDPEAPFAIDLGEGVKEEVEPSLGDDPTDDPEDGILRCTALVGGWGNEQAGCRHDPTWNAFRRVAGEMVHRGAHTACQDGRPITDPTGLPARGEPAGSSNARCPDQDIRDLEVTRGGSPGLRGRRPRITHDVEEIWSGVAHECTERLPRPPEVQRVAGITACLDTLEADQAVGLGVAAWTRDDRRNAKGNK